MKLHLLSNRYVLNSPLDDFFRMFFPTILVLIGLLFLDLTKFEAVLFFAFYFLDAGHIYSSFLEIFFDKNEFKTQKMLLISFAAIALNLLVTYIFPGKFFVYLFYFTIFHNLRQGLGVFLIYFIGSNKDRELYKYFYYFGTIVPVLLFHFRGFHFGTDATYSVRPYDISLLINQDLMSSIFSIGTYLYALIYLGIIGFLIYKKQAGTFSFIFFTLIYSIVFLFIQNVIAGMVLLVFSHGFHYFFLFGKRIQLTHSFAIVRKYSLFFVFLFFCIGAFFELTQEDASMLFHHHIRHFVLAIVFYPSTVHFIFDSFIWKKGNEKYEVFKSSIKTITS